ncbi:hypothetical protein COCNU_06G010670 [Cocos nucifera]|uniref:Uncharacterized protein n=1 Tax=Cocos nucifera TaxID=13894 RepID=A0A8K0IBG6_COCNU|nr:hypothetical protein COCNU_06G010670 [Cocos nucifera]
MRRISQRLLRKIRSRFQREPRDLRECQGHLVVGSILDQVSSAGELGRVAVQVEEGLCTAKEDPNTYEEVVSR